MAVTALVEGPAPGARTLPHAPQARYAPSAP